MVALKTVFYKLDPGTETACGSELIKVICAELDITGGCNSQVALCLQI